MSSMNWRFQKVFKNGSAKDLTEIHFWSQIRISNSHWTCSLSSATVKVGLTVTCTGPLYDVLSSTYILRLKKNSKGVKSKYALDTRIFQRSSTCYNHFKFYSSQAQKTCPVWIGDSKWCSKMDLTKIWPKVIFEPWFKFQIHTGHVFWVQQWWKWAWL